MLTQAGKHREAKKPERRHPASSRTPAYDKPSPGGEIGRLESKSERRSSCAWPGRPRCGCTQTARTSRADRFALEPILPAHALGSVDGGKRRYSSMRHAKDPSAYRRLIGGIDRRARDPDAGRRSYPFSRDRTTDSADRRGCRWPPLARTRGQRHGSESRSWAGHGSESSSR
jgi:hypothetical protein